MSDVVLRSELPATQVADGTAGYKQPAGPSSQTPFCVLCGYNLTGLASSRCPECGWVIDWSLARRNEEATRVGTPAHGAEGWGRVPAAFRTVGLMLFRPIEFARRLRYDECFLPALGIAVAACLVVVGIVCCDSKVGLDDAAWLLVYGSGCGACVLANCLFYATVCGSRFPALTWRRCFRLFVLVSLYSTCFVTAWPLVDGPPVLQDPLHGGFLWPLDDFAAKLGAVSSDPALLGRTVIFYWWAAILGVFAFVRARPRRRAVMFLLAPALSNLVAVKVATWVYFAIEISVVGGLSFRIAR